MGRYTGAFKRNTYRNKLPNLVSSHYSKNIDEQLKILYLEIPDEFTLGVIKQRYEQTLHDKAEQVIGERYRIIVQLMEEDEDDLESSIAAEVPSSVTFPQDNVEKIETTNSETPEKLQISMDIPKENKPVEPVNNILKDEVYFNLAIILTTL